MKRQHHSTAGQHSRRDVCARVRGWDACAAMAGVDFTAMLGTLTAKINPRGTSGGLLRGMKL